MDIDIMQLQASDPREEPHWIHQTERVMAMLAAGMTGREVAATCGISAPRVSHCHSIGKVLARRPDFKDSCLIDDKNNWITFIHARELAYHTSELQQDCLIYCLLRATDIHPTDFAELRKMIIRTITQ